jgi:hypothetical protein
MVMAESAGVRSIEALKDLRTALLAFGADVEEALAATELEIRRVLDKLHEQGKYWQRQIRERQEEVTRAKAALIQRRWGHSNGIGPGTTEQEIALKVAQQRLKEAEEKVQTVRKWLTVLPRDIGEYEGPARRLAGFVEADLKQGAAVLGRRIDALDAYVNLAPASEAGPAPGEAPLTP